MTWLYNDEPFDPESAPEDCAGFVYRITNLDNNMKYIGKKIFWHVVMVHKTVGQLHI